MSFAEDLAKVSQTENQNEEYEEMIADYADVMKPTVFIGEVPFDTILEGIQTQFSDYVNLDDMTNYVETFYRQLKMSQTAIEEDEMEVHKEELMEVLEDIHQQFVYTIGELFKEKLAITISAIDDEEGIDDSVDGCIEQLYTFFIINARKNFKTSILKDVCNSIKNDHYETDDELFAQVSSIMSTNLYTPLLQMDPIEFLTYTDGDDIKEMMDTHIISGNFLRKYSPKLYRNEDLQCEIISDIVINASLMGLLKASQE